MHTYVNNLHTNLNVIRQCVYINTEHYKTQMLRSANESTRSLIMCFYKGNVQEQYRNIYAGVFCVLSVDSAT